MKTPEEYFDMAVAKISKTSRNAYTTLIDYLVEFVYDDAKKELQQSDVRRSFSIDETKALYFKAYKTAWDVMVGSDNMKGMTSQKLGKDLDEDINDFWWRDTGLE